jgi:hypothetical protein
MVMSEKVDITTPEARKSLAKMIMKLFSLWDLVVADQLTLLGLGPGDQDRLVRYAAGGPLPNSRDIQDRVSRLLSIHKTLRILFPYNRDLVYRWINSRNEDFNNRTPLDILIKEGLPGFDFLVNYLNFQCSR